MEQILDSNNIKLIHNTLKDNDLLMMTMIFQMIMLNQF
jgi:hypothetical protein